MENWDYFLYLLMPFAAFMYAAVGHGGASSYLMILALLGFAPQEIRPSALILKFVLLVKQKETQQHGYLPGV